MGDDVSDSYAGFGILECRTTAFLRIDALTGESGLYACSTSSQRAIPGVLPCISTLAGRRQGIVIPRRIVRKICRGLTAVRLRTVNIDERTK